MSALRQNLVDSIAIETARQRPILADELNTPGARAGFAVFKLGDIVKDLEALNKDPLAHRHVRASREELRRLTIRLHHLLGA